jgi:flavin-dependent dehydrogenase
METAVENFDTVVIGGGPGGATTAALLARAGWSVAVLEQKDFPRRKVCGEYLSATNWPLFEALGLAAAFGHNAGPDVRRVGLFAGRSSICVELPQHRTGGLARWGRALGRERLDALLLEQAAADGACVLQPWEALELKPEGNHFRCLAVSQSGDARRVLRAPIIVAAHGSWAHGKLPTQLARRPKRGGELFGFKASFRHTALPVDLMPLISFRDGYGGLVHGDSGRVSLSCCLRRDRLASFDRQGKSAGEAVLEYLVAECPVLHDALAGAQRDQAWLSAGPIRPGIRGGYRSGIFQVGNVAGEAHPVVAEGISMAMQAAWLLAERLTASEARTSCAARDAVGGDYSTAWLKAFAPRIRAAAAIARWAMHPAAVAVSLPVVRRFPGLLAWGARCSGKTVTVCPGGRTKLWNECGETSRGLT